MNNRNGQSTQRCMVLCIALFLMGCAGGDGASMTASNSGTSTAIDSGEGLRRLQIEVWSDNWFAAYLDDSLIVEDSVSITTERSFNAETATFTGSYPLNINFIIKDFKANNTGLEYIGARNQQMGDGGFIMQVKDVDNGVVVAVSDSNMKCIVVHKAPLDKSCEHEANPVAGVAPCEFTSIEEPIDWKSRDFDVSDWSAATVYSESAVRPKDGYDEIDWNADAELIWGTDLEQDNTLLCKLTVENPSANSSSSQCEAISSSVSDAGFEEVSVTCDNSYAYITSDTYPEHDKMNGITGSNEQIPVPANNYSAPIKLSPSGVSNAITIDAALGVAVNGVPIYDYSSQGELDPFHYDPNSDTSILGQLDYCGGHSGRGDDYHYHTRPSCMIDVMKNSSDEAIIGWAYDGYPIYDLNNPDGTVIAANELDLCNGKEDDTFGYRYHTSMSAPYGPQCLRGEVDESVLPRVAPINGRTTGRPPAGGVDSLVFIEENGLVRMEYRYMNDTYFLQYQASASPNCYLFETKTISDGGQVISGEFCR